MCQTLLGDIFTYRSVTEGNGMPKLSDHRLRIGRFSEAYRPYLVTTVMEARKPIFADWVLGRSLVHVMRMEHDLGEVDSLAWVVMPDHLHWLIELRAGKLSEVVCRVKSRSTLAINKATGRTGGLWQRGFHDRAIRRDESLLHVARYIVANPLRAGLVANIGDYPLWDARWV
jgi:REP element-mobilizing transposase RayT